jgi:hypothetical protein
VRFAANGVSRIAGFHLGRPGESQTHRLVRQPVQDFHGVSDGVDVLVAGPAIAIGPNAAGGPDFQPCFPGQPRIRCDTDSKQDGIGFQCPAALQGDTRFRHGGQTILQDQMNAVVQQFLMEQLNQVEVVRCQNLIRRFDDGHIVTGLLQAFCRFAADEAAADDHDAAAGMLPQAGVQFHYIGDRVDGEHVGSVDALDGAGTDGCTTRCQDQFVVIFFIRFPRTDVADCDHFALPVDGRCFVFRPGVDVVLFPKPFRIHEDKIAALRDEPVQIVGDAAVGKGHIGTLFQHDDLRVFIETAQAGSGGRSAGDPADNDIFTGQQYLLPPGAGQAKSSQGLRAASTAFLVQNPISFLQLRARAFFPSGVDSSKGTQRSRHSMVPYSVMQSLM